MSNAMTATEMARKPEQKREERIQVSEQRRYDANLPGDEDGEGVYAHGSATLHAAMPGQYGGKPHLQVQLTGTFNNVTTLDKAIETIKIARNDLAAALGIDGATPAGEPEHSLAQNLIGCVGVCSIGKVGFITGIKKLEWGWTYVGVNLDNGQSWASKAPNILYANVAAYIARREHVARMQGERAGRASLGQPQAVAA